MFGFNSYMFIKILFFFFAMPKDLDLFQVLEMRNQNFSYEERVFLAFFTSAFALNTSNCYSKLPMAKLSFFIRHRFFCV